MFMYSLIVRVLQGLGFTLGTSGSGIDAGSITSGTIAAARLPSYVDDILEYANLAAFPATGETGKIYFALDTGIQYRWTGSAYVDIAALKFNKAGDTLTGTGGAGFFGAIPQSSAPSTPASGFRLFADSVGKLAWVGVNGFVQVFDGTANTASRTYTLPDLTGTVVLDKTPTASGTYAAMVALSSPSVGQLFICTDCNNSVWISNGTAWKPVGGYFLWDASADPRGIAPSGTIGTGSSGQLVLGTALDRSYPTGGWIYLPSIATTPAITAGFYWFTCSVSNTLTLYASKGGAAINFTVGASYTGVTTYVDLYNSPTIPAGLWGNSGGFECTYNFAVNNSATTKQPSFVLGGNTGLAATNLANITGASGGRFNIRNTQAQARQSYTANPFATSVLQGTAVAVTDMSVAQNFSFGFLRGTATDMIMLHDFEVKCFIN